MLDRVDSSDLRRYGLLIGGEEVAAHSGVTFGSINPAIGTTWATFADAGPEDVEAAVSAASQTFSSAAWQGLTASRRGLLLHRLGDLVTENAESLARIETTDNGKLHAEMAGQLASLPGWFYYYGGLADKVEGRVPPLDRPNVLNYTRREPLGVVAIIVPWNSPILLLTMGLAPALAAGNTIVVKPSEHASASVLEFARLIQDAGFPPGTVNVLTGGPAAGRELVAHPQVAHVTFTGGDAAGREIARTVGGRLARYTLELGGKSPNIVFADADLDAAEAGVLAGIFAAGGQTCVAGSRLLVEKSIHDAFVERLVARVRDIRLGDPMDPATQMGPIATRPQHERICSLVSKARDQGGELLAGGSPAFVDGLPEGLFFPPTIFADRDHHLDLWDEEVFGPVLLVAPFRDEDEAIELANCSPYGLAAGVWTSQLKRAHRVAARIKAGTVWINLYRSLAFNTPFGGYKQSGVGRENGVEAIEEYLQTKSVWVELSEEIQNPFVLKL